MRHSAAGDVHQRGAYLRFSRTIAFMHATRTFDVRSLLAVTYLLA